MTTPLERALLATGEAADSLAQTLATDGEDRGGLVERVKQLAIGYGTLERYWASHFALEGRLPKDLRLRTFWTRRPLLDQCAASRLLPTLDGVQSRMVALRGELSRRLLCSPSAARPPTTSAREQLRRALRDATSTSGEAIAACEVLLEADELLSIAATWRALGRPVPPLLVTQATCLGATVAGRVAPEALVLS